MRVQNRLEKRSYLEYNFFMSKVLITGSAGLIGSESVKFFAEKEFDVFGIDNNLRKYE